MTAMSPDGTGGGSTAYSTDTTRMRATGQSLKQVADESRRQSFGPIDGAGDARAVEEAAARFRARWSVELTRWARSLDTFSDHVVTSAATFEAADAQAATAWRGLRVGPVS